MTETYCEAMFEQMPLHELLELIKSGRLEPCDLTYAAEIAGNRTDDSEAVRATLLPLLEHEDAVVREGALYGLANHLDDVACGRLRDVTRRDRSPVIQRIAFECLDGVPGGWGN